MSLKSSLNIAKEYRKNPIGFILKVHKEQGHRIKLNVFGKKLIILTHYKDVLHVLKDNHNAYSKGRTTKKLVQFIGKGLITNEGDSWRKQHKLIRPMMNLKSIYEFGPKIQLTTQQFIQNLKIDGKVNSFQEMNRLTWRIVLDTLFTQEATQEMDSWLKDILFIMESVTKKTRATIPIPLWVPTPHHLRLKKSISKFEKFVYEMISNRRKGERKRDLLQLLIDAQDENQGMTDLQIKDEILTFLMAGHETITNTMSWMLIELARNKKYINELRDEAKNFIEQQNFENLNSSPWHSAVVDEIMRLWPPVWVFMRQAELPDKLDDLEIPVKANVIVSPFLSHRSSDFWENPLSFLPERFLPEEKKKIIPGTYYPFGLGPRACIGAHFAGLEAKIILANFIHYYEWDIFQKEDQTFEAGITLRPSNNLVMNFRRRE
jgi:cytochrome P450